MLLSHLDRQHARSQCWVVISFRSFRNLIRDVICFLLKWIARLTHFQLGLQRNDRNRFKTMPDGSRRMIGRVAILVRSRFGCGGAVNRPYSRLESLLGPLSFHFGFCSAH
jgi:hypothetical protein